MGTGHRESIDLATSARKRRFNRNTRLHSFRYYARTRSVWVVAPRDLPRLTARVNPTISATPIARVSDAQHRPVYSRVDPCGQPLGIKLRREVRREAGGAVGARVDEGWMGGP